MNIFFLSLKPSKCAKMYCDQHVIKILLEITQMLYTAWHLTGLPDDWNPPLSKSGHPGYKVAHPNHPMTIWVRSSRKNYMFSVELGCALALEYKYRFNKYHACSEHITWLGSHVPDVFNFKQSPTAYYGLYGIPQCMPPEHHNINPVIAYTSYYKTKTFAKWTINMDYIQKLKEHFKQSIINHEQELLKEPCLKNAHVYCVINNISSQQYGPLIEKYICVNYKFIKNGASNCNGDCSKDNMNVEIKVSLGGSKHNKFNWVQLRISHDIQYYILTAYHLTTENIENGGELYIFNIPKDEMILLVIKYGGYAHGTKKEYGPITVDNLNKEYALRPSYGDACWKDIIRFRVQCIT